MTEDPDHTPEISGLFTESAINAVPLNVIRILVLIGGIILGVWNLFVGVFADPVINKIVAVLVLLGSIVFYLFLLPLYWSEKRFRWIGKTLNKQENRKAIKPGPKFYRQKNKIYRQR